jgi:microcystin-dependent protein
MGQGPGLSQYDIGETTGSQTVALLESEMPNHGHTVNCVSAAANSNNPLGNLWAVAGTRGAGVNEYSDTAGPSPSPTMNGAASGIAGGSLPHNNMNPYLTLNFCIALQGVFPPRS